MTTPTIPNIPFENPAWEYQTFAHETRPGGGHPFEADFARARWTPVYQDVTPEGTLVLYRRPRRGPLNFRSPRGGKGNQ